MTSPSTGSTDFGRLLEAIGRGPDEILVVSFKRPGQRLANIWTTVKAAPEVVAQLDGQADLWFSVQPAREHDTGRVKAINVSALVTLYADLDFKGEGLTPIQAVAVIRELSARLGSDPAAIVRSGGGLQPYWPVAPCEPDLGELLLDAWKLLVIGTAKMYGGSVDKGVYDLPRILRVPGPRNLKPEYGLSADGTPLGAPTGASFPTYDTTLGHLHERPEFPTVLSRIQDALAALPVEHQHAPDVRTEHDARPETASGSGTPVDDYNTNADWDDILEPAGWTFHSRDADGTRNWTRPDKRTVDGFSATTNRGGATGQEDRLWVFTSTICPGQPFEANKPHTKYFAYAQLHHGGDLRAATRALASAGYGTQSPPSGDDWATPEKLAANRAVKPVLPLDAPVEQLIAYADAQVESETAASIYNWEYPDPNGVTDEHPDGWKAVDISGVLNGTETSPLADIATRQDGAGMFYRGKVNSLIGPSETGKSWIAVLSCVQVMRRGGIAIYLDFEDDYVNVVQRLLAIGADPEHLQSRFHYIGGNVWGHLARRPTYQSNFEMYLAMGPAIIIVDAWNQAMSSFGMAFMEHGDNSVFFESFLKQMSLSGAAVVVLDHVPKDPQQLTKGAIGPQVKRSVINGCSVKTVATKTPLVPGKPGSIMLHVDKDRLGGVRGVSADDSYFGTFRMAPDGVVAGQHECLIANPGLKVTPGDAPLGSGDDGKTMSQILAALTLQPDGLSQTKLEEDATITRSAKRTRELLGHMIEKGILELDVRGQTKLFRRKALADMTMTEQEVLDAIMGTDQA